MPVCQITQSRTTVGNNVPKSKTKTKKVIKTSIAKRLFYSQILGFKIAVKCVKRASDTIMKFGGIDSYLLNSKPSKLGAEMLAVRKRIEGSLAKKNISGKQPEEIFLEHLIGK